MSNQIFYTKGMTTTEKVNEAESDKNSGVLWMFAIIQILETGILKYSLMNKVRVFVAKSQVFSFRSHFSGMREN